MGVMIKLIRMINGALEFYMGLSWLITTWKRKKHGKTGSMSSIFDFMGNMALIFTLW